MLDAKDIATVAPGGVAVAASWLGLLDTLLSITLLSASLAFLIWRWRKALLESKPTTPIIDKKKKRKSK